MKKLSLLILAVLMISLSSCGGEEVKKAKEAAGDAVEATKEAAGDAVEATKEAAGDAVEATKEAASDAVDSAKEAVADVDGKKLFMENGCVACHNLDKKTVGPSIKEIAAAYKDKKDQMIKFLKEEADPIVDPPQFAVMKPNLAPTKKMSDAELKALVDYFMNAQ